MRIEVFHEEIDGCCFSTMFLPVFCSHNGGNWYFLKCFDRKIDIIVMDVNGNNQCVIHEKKLNDCYVNSFYNVFYI